MSCLRSALTRSLCRTCTPPTRRVVFASEYGAPYLHATTLDRTIELVRSDFSGFERVFHVCPSELPYGGGFMRTLDGCMASGTWRPPNRNIGFVHTTLPGGLSVSGSIDAAQRGGWEIDFVAEVSAPETDWSDVLEQVRQRAPAVVLIAHDFPADLAAFLRGFARIRTHIAVRLVHPLESGLPAGRRFRRRRAAVVHRERSLRGPPRRPLPGRVPAALPRCARALASRDRLRPGWPTRSGLVRRRQLPRLSRSRRCVARQSIPRHQRRILVRHARSARPRLP